MPQHLRRVAKQPSVQRLPAYLRLIKELRDQGEDAISTTYLADLLDLQPIIVRKDLSVTGIVGRPRIGYDVGELIAAIEAYLGWDQIRDAVLVGVGHLGTALLGYHGLTDYRLRVVAASSSHLRNAKFKVVTSSVGSRSTARERLGRIVPFPVAEKS